MLSEAKIDSELMQSLGDGMKKLSDTAGQLSTTADAAGATQEYSDQLSSAAKNMESLNALYQVQLDNSKTQVEMQNSVMEKLGNTVDKSQGLAEEVAQLTKNIGNLNNVYGGMLSAMTVKA
jgi:methyl-accepting chemotaxis protein